MQNDRRPSPDRQGWVDITLDLAVTRFGPEEVSASRISYLVDGDSVCFENSGPPNDCVHVVWGSNQQFNAEFDQPTRPTTLDVPSGSAVLLSLTFEVAENAASASLVAGETTVPIDLQATARAVGALDEPLPAPTPPPGSSDSANTAGYFMDRSYGIAVTGVSREPDKTGPTLSVATVELSLLSLHEPDGLAPGIRRTATPGTACFVSEPEDECIRVRWGDELQYQAMLSLSPDGVESWPRGMGWQGNVSFPLPVGVTGATLSFGEHRIPIDLRGMTGGAPTYDYTAHYPEFAVTLGSQLYDAGGMTITLESVRHDADSGDLALVFSAANDSEAVDFNPRIELMGTRVSSGGGVFDGKTSPGRPQMAPLPRRRSGLNDGQVARPHVPMPVTFGSTDPWIPVPVIVTDTLAPGQTRQLELDIPRSGLGSEHWDHVPYSPIPEYRPDGAIVQLTVSDGTAAAEAFVSEPAYVRFRRSDGESDHWAGERAWLFRTGTDTTLPPVAANGLVFAAANNFTPSQAAARTDWGHLYALDAMTGTVVWNYTTGRRTSVRRGQGPPVGYVSAGPVVDGSTVYVGSRDSYVHAVDAGTGELVWKTPLDDGVESLSGVVDGALYVGSYGSVHALDAGTGEQLWMAAMPETLASVSAGEEGAVYAAFHDGYIYALDADSGDRVWKFDAWFPPHRSTAVADGLLYVSSHDRLYALDARTGAQVWKTMIENRPDPSPAVADGVVYVGSSNALHALDAATGQRLWKTEFEEDTWVSSPVVSDGVVYMSSAGSRLHAMDAGTGDLLWHHSAERHLTWLSPVVANGLVYAGSTNAYLYAVVASAPR